jgi:hypothetical protein
MVHAIGGAAGLRLQLCGFQYTENASRGRGGFVTSETHGMCMVTHSTVLA